MADGSERLKVLGIMMRTVDRFTPAMEEAWLEIYALMSRDMVRAGKR